MSGLVGSIGLLVARTYYSLRSGGGRLVVPVIGLLLLAVAATFAWSRWGGMIVKRPEYRLSAENVQVPKRPEWIHADVKAEVIRDGTLAGVGILDADVTVKVARAFELHPWVARVSRVSKSYPGTLSVDLQYRRPIAMVVVFHDGKRWLLPVDDQAVLLPGQDFSPTQAKNFLRIDTGNVAASGPVGSRWEDPRVIGAVRIAKSLEACWRDLALYEITLVTPSDAPPSFDDLQYVIATRPPQPSRLVWGHAPGSEQPGEAGAQQKVAALLQFVQRNGPVGTGDVPADLDLRDGSARPVKHTAWRQ